MSASAAAPIAVFGASETAHATITPPRQGGYVRASIMGRCHTK
jgi:hypothetical protein